MNLFENKLKGTYIIFVAGTGIVPVIDLICFTLRYMVDKISVILKKTKKRNLIFPNENLHFDEIISPDYKLYLYVTNVSKYSVIYIDLFIKMKNLDKKYKLDIFKLTTWYSSDGEEKWDNKFVHSQLLKYKNSINKIILSGPVRFMDTIKNAIYEKEIIRRDKIIIVYGGILLFFNVDFFILKYFYFLKITK